MIDPERLRSYLQMACSGLGFDIGEVWMTSTNGSSGHGDQSMALTSTTTELKHAKHIRFVQLYTSRSYDDKRSKLVSPSKSLTDRLFTKRDTYIEDLDDDDPALKVEEAKDAKKHILSPRLVDIITYTSQVVWANCQKREGLLGRSDVRLQTAVGMPIAEDGRGHMCVLVMFSPDNIYSNDDAMEYLQFVRQTAVSSTIPCLMPAIQPIVETGGHSHKFLPISFVDNSQQQPENFGDGVVARFVSFRPSADDEFLAQDGVEDFMPEVHMVHDVRDAPKDCFGIPMLPSYAEFGITNETQRSDSPLSQTSSSEAFDEASYGIWSTVMQLAADTPIRTDALQAAAQSIAESDPSYGTTASDDIFPTDLGRLIPAKKRERLEEFAMGFLGMSVFDIADVWIPLSDGSLQVLRCVATATSSVIAGEKVEKFKRSSATSSVSMWSGAVGRAFGSGNPVWSSNYNVICDSTRADVFDSLNIKTALAIPTSTPGSFSSDFVVCFYSMIRTDADPVVLRFLQQAIRLVWDGLESVVPKSSTGIAKEIWNDVHPTDLGEMAADLEMQNAFTLRKKRALSYTDLSLFSAQSPHNNPASNFVTEANSGPRCDTLLNDRMETLNVEPTNVGAYLSTQIESTQWYVEDSSNSPYPLSNRGTSDAETVVVAQPIQGEPQYGSFSQRMKIRQTSPNSGGSETVTQSQWFPIQSGEAMENVAQIGTSYEYQGMPQTFDSHKLVSPHQQHQAQPSLGQEQLDQFEQPAALQLSTQQSNMRRIQPMQVPQARPVVQLLHHMDYSVPRAPEKPAVISTTQVLDPPSVVGGWNVMKNGQRVEPSPLVPPTLQFCGQALQMSSSGKSQIHLPGRIVSYSSMDTMNSTQPDGHVGPEQEVVQVPVAPPVLYPTVAPQSQHDAMTFHGGADGLADFDASVLNNFCQPLSSVDPYPEHFESSEKICRIQGCDDFAMVRRPYCIKHNGSRLCEHSGCTKCAQGSTKFCIAHGGGRRCTFPGCDKGARDKLFCAAHGGGKRCSEDGCNKSAVGGSNRCTSHGGGRRCSVEGCTKSAQSCTSYCVKHGGGKKCAYAGCKKVARGRTLYCAAHGGGVRCRLEDCARVAVGKQQLCRVHGGGARQRSPPVNSESDFTSAVPVQDNGGPM